MEVLTRPDVQYERHLLERNASHWNTGQSRHVTQNSALASSCSHRQVVITFSHIIIIIVIITLWSSGQSFWLQIQRSRVRFPALPDFSE